MAPGSGRCKGVSSVASAACRAARVLGGPAHRARPLTGFSPTGAVGAFVGASPPNAGAGSRTAILASTFIRCATEDPRPVTPRASRGAAWTAPAGPRALARPSPSEVVISAVAIAGAASGRAARADPVAAAVRASGAGGGPSGFTAPSRARTASSRLTARLAEPRAVTARRATGCRAEAPTRASSTTRAAVVRAAADPRRGAITTTTGCRTPRRRGAMDLP